MNFQLTVRFQTSGRATERRQFPNWAAINEYIMGLGKPGPLPRGTVATVAAPEGIVQRYSIRGGGTETVKMIPLTNKMVGLPENENTPAKKRPPPPAIIPPDDPGFTPPRRTA